MLGAIVGDMVGSVYEFDRVKRTEFEPFLHPEAGFTDDTVMTIAILDAMLEGHDYGQAMRNWALKYQYPKGGYGGRFVQWLADWTMGPYGSFGNGSAMRVSAAGWLHDDLESVLIAARETALPTHDHPEGIKGAQATAGAIYLARRGNDKAMIRQWVTDVFGYDLDRTVAEIREVYEWDGTCQGTVPEAIVGFLESSNFESAVRNVISYGGDADTLGAITGAIAGAYYGVPDDIGLEALMRLPPDMQAVLQRFDWRVQSGRD